MRQPTRLAGLLLTVSLAACGRSAAEGGSEAGGVTTRPEDSGEDLTTTATSSEGNSESNTGGEEEQNFTPFLPDEGTCCGGSEGFRCTPLTCSIYEQGCPEGEKCVPFDENDSGQFTGSRCVLVLGERGVGEVCSSEGFAAGSDDCDSESYCLGLAEGGLGTCRSFCAGTAEDPVCAPGTICAQQLGAGSYDLCLPSCEADAECEEDEGCYLWSEGLICLPAGEFATGEPCSFPGSCEPGNYCLVAESVVGCMGSQCCAPKCDTSGDGLECEQLPGSECVPVYEDPDVDDTKGVCVDPTSLP